MAAVYRGRLPGVSCLAACTTFAKPPEQRHSGDGPYPCSTSCPRPNCRTPRLYHIEGCVGVCHGLPQVVPPPAKPEEEGSERAAPTASEALSSIWLPRPWPRGRAITSIRATYIVLQASDHACRNLSLLQPECRRKFIVSSRSSFPAGPSVAQRAHSPIRRSQAQVIITHSGAPKGRSVAQIAYICAEFPHQLTPTGMGRTRGSVEAWG